MKAVILAAGVGSRLAPLTNDRPKSLVEVNGTSFLFRQLELLAAVDIPSHDVIVVGGYKIDFLKDALTRGGFACPIVFNDHFSDWNNFYSLLVAREALGGSDFLQLDGDTILDAKLLPKVLAASGDALVAVDCRDELDDETMKVELGDGGVVRAISKKLDPATCAGEYIGVTRLAAASADKIFADLATFPSQNLTYEYYEHAYHRLTGSGAVPFGIVDVHECTVLEIDTVEDLRRAEALLGHG